MAQGAEWPVSVDSGQPTGTTFEAVRGDKPGETGIRVENRAVSLPRVWRPSQGCEVPGH